MNPAVNKATRGLGASFKGVVAYLLTDKREVLEQAQAEGRDAPNRAGFVLTRNLPSDDAQHAWRLMASTARRREELKAEAGVSRAGRKPKEGEFRPVFHYTLNWRADERVTEREMIAAADKTLKVLQLQDHEALIVQHTDRDHPHLHIVVNRVHPETGKLATLSNNWRKLDREARDHERARGHVVSPNRDAKYRSFESKAQPPRAKRWTTHQEHKRGPAHRALVDEVHATYRPEWSRLGREKAAERKALDQALKVGDFHGFVRQHGETILAGYKTPQEAVQRAAELTTAHGLKEALGRAHKRQTADLAKAERAEVRRRELGRGSREGDTGGVKARVPGRPIAPERYDTLREAQQPKAKPTMAQMLAEARGDAHAAHAARRTRGHDDRGLAGDAGRSRDRERD